MDLQTHIFKDSWAIANGLAFWSGQWLRGHFPIEGMPTSCVQIWKEFVQSPIPCIVTHVSTQLTTLHQKPFSTISPNPSVHPPHSAGYRCLWGMTPPTSLQNGLSLGSSAKSYLA